MAPGRCLVSGRLSGSAGAARGLQRGEVPVQGLGRVAVPRTRAPLDVPVVPVGASAFRRADVRRRGGDDPARVGGGCRLAHSSRGRWVRRGVHLLRVDRRRRVPQPLLVRHVDVCPPRRAADLWPIDRSGTRRVGAALPGGDRLRDGRAGQAQPRLAGPRRADDDVAGGADRHADRRESVRRTVGGSGGQLARRRFRPDDRRLALVATLSAPWLRHPRRLPRADMAAVRHRCVPVGDDRGDDDLLPARLVAPRPRPRRSPATGGCRHDGTFRKAPIDSRRGSPSRCATSPIPATCAGPRRAITARSA
jgi:hypothetical protein